MRTRWGRVEEVVEQCYLIYLKECHVDVQLTYLWSQKKELGPAFAFI